MTDPEENGPETARDEERTEPIEATPTANPTRVRMPPEGPKSHHGGEPDEPGRRSTEEA